MNIDSKISPEVSEVAVEQLALHHRRIEALLLAFTPFEAIELSEDDAARLEVGFLRQAGCLRADPMSGRTWWITDLGLDVLCKNR